MPEFKGLDLARWSGGEWAGGCPARLAGVSADTRTLAPGALFVALRGARFDGHRFVAEAFARGAAAALVDRDAAGAPAAGPRLLVADTARALANLAAGYRRGLRALIVGVTGSLGKTTVKDMAADVLARRGPTARSLGNWNNAIGLPLSLLAMEPGCRFGVFEAGMNHPGELQPLIDTLRPDWGLVTAIGPVHLEFFESVEAIAREKSALLRALPPGGTALLRRDDPYYGLLAAAAPGRVLTVALEGEADYRGRLEGGRLEILEAATGETCRVSAPLPGAHHAGHALLAAAVGRAQGLDWASIRGALESFRPQPMRWERRMLAGVSVINDAYNANPVSMAAALRTFAGVACAGGRWLVLAGMHELGESEARRHEELGASLAGDPWAGVITVGRLGGAIAAAALRAGVPAERVFACADHEAAAETLRRCLRPGDAVLFKASRGQQLERVLERWQALGAPGVP